MTLPLEIAHYSPQLQSKGPKGANFKLILSSIGNQDKMNLISLVQLVYRFLKMLTFSLKRQRNVTAKFNLWQSHCDV